MSNNRVNWLRSYSILQDYLTSHPAIKLGEDRVSIPNGERQAFYHLFDETRRTFIEEAHPGLVKLAVSLRNQYQKQEQSIKTAFGLSKTEMDPNLDRFLSDPLGQSVRVLYEPLFDLLKGRMNSNNFMSQTGSTSSSALKWGLQQGYQKWIVLALIEKLGFNAIFRNHNRELTSHEAHQVEFMPLPEPVPEFAGSNKLSFRYQQELMFCLPDFAIQILSKEIFLSFCTKVYRPFGIAQNVPKSRTWLSIDPISFSESQVILVYLAKNLDELAVVADVEQLCQPDILIISLGLPNEYANYEFKNILCCHDALRPRKGTYIVAVDSLPTSLFKDKDSVYPLKVGFKSSNLFSIISALSYCS